MRDGVVVREQRVPAREPVEDAGSRIPHDCRRLLVLEDDDHHVCEPRRCGGPRDSRLASCAGDAGGERKRDSGGEGGGAGEEGAPSCTPLASAGSWIGGEMSLEQLFRQPGLEIDQPKPVLLELLPARPDVA